jgi:CDP-glucose 4,6-dehydratase
MKKIIENYKNLKILITGNTGFKGTWLSHWLLNMGAKVVGVGLSPEKDSVLFKELNLNRRVKQYIFDIKNFDKINQIVKKEKPDLIFHLAAQSIVSSSYRDPLKTFQSNILGSANLLEAFRKNNTPSMIYITSDKCYLNLDLKKDYKESDELGGLDNYSSSKASAELIFSSYFHSYFKDKKKHLSLGTVRAGNVIGGGDMKTNRLIPDIVKSIKDNKKILIRNPHSTRPWQHVLEPLSGYLILGQKLLNKKIKITTYPSWNFGPERKNCKNVITIVKKILTHWEIKKKIIIKKEKMHEAKFLSLNINKAKKELNWRPKLSLDQTIGFTIDWYKSFFEAKKMQNFSSEQIEEYMDYK